MGTSEFAMLGFAALTIGVLLFRLCVIIVSYQHGSTEVDEDSEFHSSMRRWGYLHDRREGGEL